METRNISKVVPVGTYLYRYDFGDDIPKKWTTEYHNKQYLFNRGCKNRGGFFFFYEDKQTAKETLLVANKDAQSHINTITSCHTTREVKLLDLSLFGTPSELLSTLFKHGIDVFIKGFRRYADNSEEDLMLDSINESFMKMIEINIDTCTNKNLRTVIELSNQINNFFYSSELPGRECQYIGQFFTDFDNGPIFKQILLTNGFDGYCFRESPTSLTYCLFDSTALSAPTQEIINFLINNEDFDKMEKMNNNSYFYEPGGGLNIPLAGRFLKIDYRGDDRTTTILNTGEQEIVLNGRCLKTAYSPEVWD